MSDRLHGSCWSNPIWHGRWRIYVAASYVPYAYEFVHDDYDGAPDANDNRYGFAASVDEAKSEIDELEDAA